MYDVRVNIRACLHLHVLLTVHSVNGGVTGVSISPPLLRSSTSGATRVQIIAERSAEVYAVRVSNDNTTGSPNRVSDGRM